MRLSSQSFNCPHIRIKSIPAFTLMAGPEWRYVELPTSHWAMFSEPAKLADILLDAAAGRV